MKELGEKVLAFLDSPGWSLNGDLSGIELVINGKKLAISFEYAQCICWNYIVITEDIESRTLKKIRAKGRSIYLKLKEKRLQEIEKKHAESIQNVLEEMKENGKQSCCY